MSLYTAFFYALVLCLVSFVTPAHGGVSLFEKLNKTPRLIALTSTQPKCSLTKGTKKVVKCKSLNPYIINYRGVGSITMTLMIKEAKLLGAIVPNGDAIITRYGADFYQIGSAPAAVSDEEMGEVCDGAPLPVEAIQQFTALDATDATGCCGQRAYIQPTITLCTANKATCATKTFTRSIKIQCVNICNVEGKTGTPLPMQLNGRDCPTCDDS